MHYVYVLKHPLKPTLYYGCTADLKRRFQEHQQLPRHRGWKLVYYEAYRNEQDARDREQQLKQYGAARGHLKARIKRSMTEELESAGEARCPSPRECRP